MIYGLYHSAAGMLTNEYRQAVLANNLANADTVGFKRDVAIFAERRRADDAGFRTNASDSATDGLSGGVWLGATHTDFTDGKFVRTENPLDVALEGPGYLMVERDGVPLLTRDGRMMMDRGGRLISAADGSPMLTDNGAPIVLNPNARNTSIDETGRISQDGAIVGELGVVNVEDHRQLVKAGSGRWLAEKATRVPSTASVHSGFVESSTVDPVPALVDMIEASRAYQINAQMLSLQDQTLGRLISDVARV